MAPAARAAFREQIVPRVMKAAPTPASARYANRRARHGPRISVSTRMANDPKAAKSDVCGWPMTLSAKANTAGMTIAARAPLLTAPELSAAPEHTPRLGGDKPAKKGRPG